MLSPESFERDVLTKRREYAEAGARHYLVVELETPLVVAYAGEDELVERARARGDDELRLADPLRLRLRPASLVED